MTSSTTYTYDAMSNRLSKETATGTTTYTYNELNQLTVSSDATYTYDADGDQIAVQEAARAVMYHYNDLGRMSSAVVQSLGQTTVETYRYNGNGIRIAKSTDGTETRYLIDPNGALVYVLAEYDADGNVSAYYTRGTELISRETSGEIRYYQYDPNGSVRLLTDASGDISDTYTYDAFGSLIFQTGTSGNSFLFQGEQYDAATGLYYLRARYMNPATGTFTTMDAYQGSTSDPMSLHKYLFANGNPVMNSDPSGYSPVTQQGAAIAIMTVLEAGCISAAIYSAFSIFDVVTGKATMTFDQFAFGLGHAFLKGLVLGAISLMTAAILSAFITSVGLGIVCASAIFILSKAADTAAQYFNANGNYFWASVMQIIREVLLTIGFTVLFLGLFTMFGGSSQPNNSKPNSEGASSPVISEVVGEGPFKNGELFETSFTSKTGVEIQGLAEVEVNGTTACADGLYLCADGVACPSLAGYTCQ